jgi:hypothetical protein
MSAAALLLASGAEARCWREQEMSAVRLRQMQTMLMVATLRCRAAGMDISDEYNGFVTAHRPALDSANAIIRRHFAGPGTLRTDYDRFATSLANGYGRDATTMGDCAAAGMLARDGAAASRSALGGIVTTRFLPPALPDGACAAAGATERLASIR